MTGRSSPGDDIPVAGLHTAELLQDVYRTTITGEAPR
jgi:hypothetical protein